MSNFTTKNSIKSIAKIYVIENLLNHRKYIGFTTASLHHRWRQHVYDAKKQSKFYLHKAIQKYGKENFSIVEIYSSKDIEHTLYKMEPFFIKQFDTYKNGYNMTVGGDGVIGYKGVRRPHSQETIQKMKDNWTTERRTEVSKRFSKPLTEEHRRKIAVALKGISKPNKCKGRKCSPEQIENNRQAQLKRFANTPMSEETRKKMSLARKGILQSPELIEKRATALRGRKCTPEQIEKNRQTQLALHRKHTETEIQKMKEARRRYLEHNESNAVKNWVLWHKDEPSPFLIRNIEKWALEKGLRGDSLQKVAKGIRNSDHGYRVWRKDKCPDSIKCHLQDVSI